LYQIWYELGCVPKKSPAQTNIALASHSSVKVVGANGRISLDKQFAGRQVLVEEREPGMWMVRKATVIPDNERWLHEPQAATDLRFALTWAAANPATDSTTDDLMNRLSDGDK